VCSCAVSERAYDLARHLIGVASEGYAQELCQRSVTARQSIEAHPEPRTVALGWRHAAHDLAVGDDRMMTGQFQGDAHVDARCHRQRSAQEQATLTEVDRRPKNGCVFMLEPATAAHGSSLIDAGASSGLPLNWNLG
jgi:hypothetical protein